MPYLTKNVKEDMAFTACEARNRAFLDTIFAQMEQAALTEEHSAFDSMCFSLVSAPHSQVQTQSATNQHIRSLLSDINNGQGITNTAL